MKRLLLLFYFVFLSTSSYGQENCNNGIDDDGDGLIDLNDTDCNCVNVGLTSLFPNPSFETFSYCPSSNSQLDLAVPWQQATNATTDFFHNCYPNITYAIMAFGLQNFPDGNGAVGAFYRDTWKEYLGLQLTTPLLAGTNYQLTFQIAGMISDPSSQVNPPFNMDIYEPVNVTIFGNPNSTSFPVPTQVSPNTADPNWIDIGNVKYNPTSDWKEITILFTPSVNINSLMIGAPSVLPSSYHEVSGASQYAFFLYDNLILNKSSDFKVNITSTGSMCSNNLVLQSNLTTTFNSNVTYQWYKNNIAIIGATNPNCAVPFNVNNIGSYCVKITNGSQCYISNRLEINDTTVSPSVAIIQPTCITLNGSINVTSPAAQYSFDGGTTWQTSSNSGTLPPNRYYIRTRNSQGCVSELTVVDLFYPTLINAPQYTTVQPNCTTSQGTGISITITSVGSMFSFDDGVTWTTNNTATNLMANSNYYIRYKDLSGCMSNRAQVYLYTQYLDNPPSISIQQPTDCVNNYGIVTVLTNAALYSFDNGNTWSNSPISAPLSQGSHMVRIKPTANSCQSYPTSAVINPPSNTPSLPNYIVVQPLTCSSPFGMISITSIASQYSFDDGLTWSNNPISGNLPVGNYLLKVKDITNCISPSVSVTIIPPADFPATPNFTITQPDCFNQNGALLINSLGIEFSIDNGITWGMNNSFTNLTPGSYQVKVKNALGCISDTSNATVIPFTAFPIQPSVTSQQSFCVQENATLSSIAITGQNIKWYPSSTGGNLLPNTTSLLNGQTYFASQTVNSCESLRTPVLVTIQNTPTPNGTAIQNFCSTQNATLNDVIINGTDLNWYSSSSNTNSIPNTTLLANGITYYVTQTINNCESVNRFAVTINLINTLNAYDYSETICDDLNDGVEIIDLTTYNTNLISDVSNCTFEYYSSLSGAANQINSDLITSQSTYNLTTGNHIIYVRVTSNNGCHQIVELNISLVSNPIITINDVVPICENTAISINAGSGFNSYIWSTGSNSQSISISQAGNYSVTVTKSYGTTICSSTKNFTAVLSNVATITNIETQDWTDNENIIIVNTSSNSYGNYEFSIDGINYQDSNIFSGLNSGEYIVYVRDKNGCGITEENIFLLMYPKFFTPNGDGYNDTWAIKFSFYEPNLKVNIFDRYGKLLKTLNNANSWDGEYNGYELPSSDYWFVVTRENGKEYRGHFTLKR